MAYFDFSKLHLVNPLQRRRMGKMIGMAGDQELLEKSE